MIIQTAPAGEPRLAIMMHEHTALSGQFARAFGNDHFEPVRPHDLMFFIVSHHDEGWAEFDRDPVTDERTGLPYNLVETPVEYITITSRAVARFQRAAPPLLRADIKHAQLGPLQRALWALGIGPDRQNSAPVDRPLAERMLAGEINRQKRLKAEIAKNPEIASSHTSIKKAADGRQS